MLDDGYSYNGWLMTVAVSNGSQWLEWMVDDAYKEHFMTITVSDGVHDGQGVWLPRCMVDDC